MRKDKTLIEACKDIVTHKQHARWQGNRIDLYSANAYVQVYNKLSPENQKKLESLPFGSQFGIIFNLLNK